MIAANVLKGNVIESVEFESISSGVDDEEGVEVVVGDIGFGVEIDVSPISIVCVLLQSLSESI